MHPGVAVGEHLLALVVPRPDLGLFAIEWLLNCVCGAHALLGMVIV